VKIDEGEDEGVKCVWVEEEDDGQKCQQVRDLCEELKYEATCDSPEAFEPDSKGVPL
jgi:hypothetical protein